LYGLPYTRTSNRQRNEYREIPTEEPVAQGERDGDLESDERELIKNEGRILLWSFTASSALTVCLTFDYPSKLQTENGLAYGIFLPRSFHNPSFRGLFSQGVVVVLDTKLVIHWAR
jgi:hypothetical protein